jgi:hypothetical protein
MAAAARAAAGSALLANGLVLVAGGIDDDGGGTLATAELYNPATHGWSSGGTLTTARDFLTLTSLTNGQALAAGGVPGNGAPLASAELYSPSGVGGTIYASSGMGSTLQVNSTTPADPIVGFQVHVSSTSSSGVSLVGINADCYGSVIICSHSFCQTDGTVAGDLEYGCVTLGGDEFSSGGPLANFTFNANGNGCIVAHLVTAPDDVNLDTYTVDATTSGIQAVVVNTSTVPILVGTGSLDDCPGVPLHDFDGDGIMNSDDNCPMVANPNQRNTDQFNALANLPGTDALGDACDLDIDGDGYNNAQEATLGKNSAVFCAIVRADVDGDGSVTILDLSQIARSFGQSVPPAPERKSQDGDNGISILDISRAAQYFGRPVTQCP